MRHLLLLSLLAILAACTSSDGGGGNQTGTAEKSERAANGEVSSVNSKLVILHSSASVSQLVNPQDQVTFTVTASDNGSVDSLAGAILVDDVTGATYGSFASGTQKGSYSLTLRKFDLEKVRPIEPSPDGQERRSFQIVVMSASSDNVSTSVAVTLQGQKYGKIAPSFYRQLPTDITQMDLFKTQYIGQDEFGFECRNWKVEISGGRLRIIEYDVNNHPSETVVEIWQKAEFDGHGVNTTIDAIGDFDKLQTAFQSLGFGYSEHFIAGSYESFRVNGFGIRCIQRPNSEVACWSYAL